MIHLDLFSGIGGFAYAADQVWDNVEHIFCDNDKFCRQVLNKHWPEAKIYDDIRDITDTEYKRWRRLDNEQRNRNKSKTRGSNQWCDLLTGGFPCQPFSQAGIRRGVSDDRYLWPEMLRVIQLTQPQWVIAENVRGLLTLNEGVVFEQVCTDLEATGYEVQPFIIPAVAINAPHRRDRIWFVANARRERQVEQQLQTAGSKQYNFDDTDSKRRGRRERLSQRAGKRPGSGYERYDTWDRNWLEVTTELCSVDDGLPVSLDGFELSKAGHRKEQLKSLGNAIVPQVAMEIMRGMK